MYKMFMLFVVKVKLNKCGTAKNNLGLGSTKLKNNRARCCFFCC